MPSSSAGTRNARVRSRDGRRHDRPRRGSGPARSTARPVDARRGSSASTRRRCSGGAECFGREGLGRSRSASSTAQDVLVDFDVDTHRSLRTGARLRLARRRDVLQRATRRGRVRDAADGPTERPVRGSVPALAREAREPTGVCGRSALAGRRRRRRWSVSVSARASHSSGRGWTAAVDSATAALRRTVRVVERILVLARVGSSLCRVVLVVVFVLGRGGVLGLLLHHLDEFLLRDGFAAVIGADVDGVDAASTRLSSSMHPASPTREHVADVLRGRVARAHARRCARGSARRGSRRRTVRRPAHR